jgi:hypothetical protein
MRENELIGLIEQLDPTRSEAPPAPGSSRYVAIEEQAMATITDTESATDSTTSMSTSTPQAHRPLRRWPLVAAAAAVVVAIGAAVVLQPGSEPSAEATVVAAADELAKVTSLRTDMHFDNVTFGEGDLTVAVSGDDYDSVWEMRSDGGEVESERIVVIDGIEHHTDSTGQTTKQPIELYDDTDGSFAESSAAVVDAVVQDAEVEDVDREEVRGVDAARYRVEIPMPASRPWPT